VLRLSPSWGSFSVSISSILPSKFQEPCLGLPSPALLLSRFFLPGPVAGRSFSLEFPGRATFFILPLDGCLFFLDCRKAVYRDCPVPKPRGSP